MVVTARDRLIKQRLQTATVAVALCLVSVLSVGAATLEDYKKRIDSAHTQVEDLLGVVSEAQPDTRNAQFEKNMIGRIRASLPATETIDLPGGTVETDNKWLLEELDRFQVETDKAARQTIMTGVDERLAAILEKLDEIENAVASARTKDEQKQKLGEILRREEYQKPQVKEESLCQKWRREFMEWLARELPAPSFSPSTASGFGWLQVMLQILIYAAVIGLVVFLIYKFAPFLSTRFGLSSKAEKADRVILGERIGDDVSGDDLFSEAERLAREGHLRAAIRKGYMAFLCELSDRKVIGLARHKTNRDYLRDVRKIENLFENLSSLTSKFENNWYGLRRTEQSDWDDFRVLYVQAKSAGIPTR